MQLGNTWYYRTESFTTRTRQYFETFTSKMGETYTIFVEISPCPCLPPPMMTDDNLLYTNVSSFVLSPLQILFIHLSRVGSILFRFIVSLAVAEWREENGDHLRLRLLLPLAQETATQNLFESEAKVFREQGVDAGIDCAGRGKTWPISWLDLIWLGESK